MQPAYADNWFAKPPLPCNLNWAQATQHQQWVNNQASYPNHNPPLPLYVNGAYNTERDNTTAPPPEDFDPNETYSWTPVAGGKGFGNPSGSSDAQDSGTHLVTPSGQSSSQVSSQDSGTHLVTPGGQSSGQVSSQGSPVNLVRPSKAEEDDCDEYGNEL